MKQDLVKQENVKLKKKIKSLTIEIDSLEYEIKHKDESLSYYIESNQLALEIVDGLKKYADENTKDKIKKFENMTGKGKRRSIKRICNYVEIIRIHFNEDDAFRNWKKITLLKEDIRDWTSTVTYFNEINKTKIDCSNTFLVFLDIISTDRNPIEIYNYFKDGKSNKEIAKLLKDNFEL